MFRLSALAALALSACAAPAPTLTVSGDRLFVDARVNGVAVEALIDSAAEISFADKTWAQASGLYASGEATVKGTGGTAEISFVEGVAVDALGVRLDGLTIGVLDLADISNRLVGRRVDFVLGRELFDRERLAIDIEGGAIAIADRNEAPSGVRAPLSGERGIETFKARVNGEELNAEFDLGNGSEALIGKATAQRLGLLDDPSSLETREGGGIGGARSRIIVRLDSLEIGGRTFRDVEAAVDDTENAGELNIGVRLLRNFKITTDFDQRSIWLDQR